MLANFYQLDKFLRHCYIPIMSKKILIFIAIVVLTGCTSQKTSVETISTPQKTVSIIPDHKPGEIPFDFPIVETISTPAKSYVLAPTLSDLKNAWNYKEKATFNFAPAILTKPDENTSTLTALNGKSFEMPNSLIIPLSDKTANPKDILLTWWQGGSGMMRALVTSEFPTEEPTITYLDDFIQSQEKLKVQSFKILSNSLQQGSPVKINNELATIINIQGDKILVQEFTGNLAVYEKDQITLVPLKPELKINSIAQAPVVGIFQEITIREINQETGRIKATYRYNNRTEEKTFLFTEVLSSIF